jgi:hypothetical protein
MKPATADMPVAVPLDDEHARMIAYARSPGGKARIAAAEAESAQGRGIVADDAYFVKRIRRHKRP